MNHWDYIASKKFWEFPLHARKGLPFNAWAPLGAELGFFSIFSSSANRKRKNMHEHHFRACRKVCASVIVRVLFVFRHMDRQEIRKREI